MPDVPEDLAPDHVRDYLIEHGLVPPMGLDRISDQVMDLAHMAKNGLFSLFDAELEEQFGDSEEMKAAAAQIEEKMGKRAATLHLDDQNFFNTDMNNDVAQGAVEKWSMDFEPANELEEPPLQLLSEILHRLRELVASDAIFDLRRVNREAFAQFLDRPEGRMAVDSLLDSIAHHAARTVFKNRYEFSFDYALMFSLDDESLVDLDPDEVSDAMDAFKQNAMDTLDPDKESRESAMD